jgi:hypothetical protein
MLKRTVSSCALLLLALLACKGGEKSEGGLEKCAGDGDCKNGFLCESAVCVPREVAERARAATAATVPQPAAAPAPSPSVAAAPTAVPTSDGPIPLVPTEPSNPPQGVEWDAGIAVNTQEIHSQPDDCDVRVLREWLQVSCRGPYNGYERMTEFGRRHIDYFERIEPGRIVSFVVRMRKGKTQSVRICAPNKRASLFVNWPMAKDRPLHIALGRGPMCEDG